MLDPDVSKRLCNYDELLERWQNFKNGNYIIKNLPRKRLSKKEFIRRLTNVQYYSAPGNIELWQELPDATPRRLGLFPKYYKRLESVSKQNNYHSKHKKVFKDSSYDVAASLTDSNVGCLPSLLIGLGLLAFCAGAFIFVIAFFRNWDCGIPFGNFSTKCDVNPHIWLFLYSDFSCVVFSIMLFVSVFTRIGQNKSYKRTVMTDPAWGHSIKPHTQQTVYDLLKKGTKTIATIIDITYIEDKDIYVERNTNPQQEELRHEIPCVYHLSPLFSITYTFNPPDDHNADHLIHRIYTHIAPEEHYKVGDPLPILYKIETSSFYSSSQKRRIYTDFVTSMPFPMVLWDVEDEDNIIALSRYEYAQ